MADDTRTVAVNLTMQIAGYLASSAKVRETNRQTITESAKLKQQVEEQKAAVEGLGRGALAAAAVFTGAFVAMVKASADFEQRMSQVQALSKATAGDMAKLRASAFSAGEAFGLSATQVADAQIELTKAGVSVKDIIGGALPGALALAAAGQLDVGKATAIATTAMTQFSLTGSDVPHVADLLAAGADKSIASVESLGDSLNQSGQVAAQFGLSVEDTVGTLTAFSKAGLNGSDAGTAFKTMLTQLAQPTKKAQDLLDEYNITTYDAQGNFVGITALADNLRSGLGKLSQEQRNAALSTIFGNDAIRASNELYKLGGDRLQGFIDGNNEAGFAALQASKKLDNLNGDLQKLGASFDNALIEGGSGATGVLRGVTKTASGLLNVFHALPEPVQGAAVVIAGVGAVTAATGAALLLLGPRAIDASRKLSALGVSGKNVAAAFGKGAGLATVLAASASALSTLGTYGTATEEQLSRASNVAKRGFKDLDKLFTDGQSGFDNFYSRIDSAGDALQASFSGNAFENLSGPTKIIDSLTFGLTHFSDVFKTNEGQFAALGEQLGSIASKDYSQAASSFNGLVKQFGGGQEVARQLLLSTPAYRNELIKLAEAAGVAADDATLLQLAQQRGGDSTKVLKTQQEAAAAAARQHQSALSLLAGAADDGTTSIDDLKLALEGLDGGQLSARAAARQFEQAIDDATKAAKDNGKTLDINTQKGRDNQAALDGIASAAAESAKAYLDAGGSAAGAAKRVAAGRAAYVRTAEAMGFSTKKANDLADSIFNIPTSRKTKVAVDGTGKAITSAEALQRKLNELTNGVYTVNVRIAQSGSVNNVVPTGVRGDQRKADGGPIVGPGPDGKDSELIWAAPGEHMVTDREVKAVGGHGNMYRIRAAMVTGTLRGYAGGGAIDDSTKAAEKAAKEAARYQRQLAAEKRNLRAQERQVEAAQKRYDDIDGTKKNQARKKAARAAVERQQKDVDNVEKKIAAIEKKLGLAQDREETARGNRAELREGREDFVSSERRGGQEGLGYVDQLRSLSRDENFSAARRKQFKEAANDNEKALYNLGKESEAAAKKVEEASSSLNELTQSSAQMVSSISSSITGGFRASDAVTTTQDQTITRQAGNLTYTTTQKGGSSVTGSGISAFYRNSRASAESFAADLQQLTGKVDGRLLAEIAGYGVEVGAPIARALLSASSAEISSINTDYAGLQAAGDRAGQTVADANFKALIDAAQRQLDAENANADRITKAIAEQAASLRSVIGKAFGLPGYKAGAWLTPGGRDEIAGFVHGQETVLNAEESIAYRRSVRQQDARLSAMRGGYSSGSSGITVVPSSPVRVEVAFADSALRSMVDVRIAEHDRAGAIEIEVV